MIINDHNSNISTKPRLLGELPLLIRFELRRLYFLVRAWSTMELDLFDHVLSEGDTVDAEANDDGSIFEGERCGICMDVIIDRGVLDCCQHWFCFVCIDNWSTITNLCPLCQNEFHLITCVPVYDTIGTNKPDEDMPRDDDWSVEGTNKTLSFPSYYIDENAVTCLDGDGCKIRSESVSLDENSSLDTSIACDSCDIWYHAVCVGFDPEGTSVDSWLCPRCLDEAQQKSRVNLVEKLDRNCNLDSADVEYTFDECNSKVLITVADAGETAVVVSMIDRNQVAEEPTERSLSTLNLDKNHLLDQSILPLGDIPSESKKSTDKEIEFIHPNIESDDLHISPKGDISLKLPLDSLESKLGIEDEMISRSRSFDNSEILATEDQETHVEIASVNDESTAGDAVSSSVIGQKRKGSDQSDEKQFRLPTSAATKMGKVGEGSQRAMLDDRTDKYGSNENFAADSDGKQFRLPTGASKKKGKVGECSQKVTLDDRTDKYTSNEKQNFCNRTRSTDQRNRNKVGKKPPSCDIMSIVHDIEPTTMNGIGHKNPAEKPLKNKNAAKLRMKKIMRRPAEGTESSVLVQKLRQEIREVVHNKSSGDIGKTIFDPKLLAAFRAAVSTPVSGPTRNESSAALKAKKLFLQKGKKRENLTRKIYSTSSGKRRRAWGRDCEVEFWKHRCLETTKPEKIETLKSVLDLLTKSPETIRLEANSEEMDNSPILSRLYLADASVFPRKDDMKPLSVLKASGSLDGKCGPTPLEMNAKSFLDNCTTIKMPEGGKALPCTDQSDSIDKKLGVAPGKKQAEKSTLSGDSNADTQKKIVKSVETTNDKRKWALQVLARKTALVSKSSMQEKQQDNALAKGNYPLLAQLPLDMRPKPASSRHNKIPIAVRQAQLYRLAEHLLKMTNLSTMHRTAATELAIADAINIERVVADKASSKPIYLNLCSLEVRRCASGRDSSLVPESMVTDEGTEPSTPAPSIDSEAEAALRAAGLLSDSPPNSPSQNVETPNDDNKRGPNDKFEMNPNAELDIYGDFEYDLDDEDYIGASAFKGPEVQAEEGDSRMKVVFSTLGADKSNQTIDAGDHERADSENPSSSGKLPDCQDNGDGSLLKDNNGNTVCLAPDSIGEGGEEPTLEECEELYGPEEVPPIKNFPEIPSSEKLRTQNISNDESAQAIKPSELVSKKVSEDISSPKSYSGSASKGDSLHRSQAGGSVQKKHAGTKADKHRGKANPVVDKVQAYIKEHIRPLCKSGIISVEQYRWAVGKTTDKVMKYHSKAKSADFLIKEGEKVKKLAEEYVEAAKRQET